MLVELRKHLQYCMGFSFLNEQTYADELAEVRHEENILQAKLDMLFKFLQLTSMREAELAEDEEEITHANFFHRPMQRMSRLIMVGIVVTALPFMLLAKPITSVVMIIGRGMDNAVRGIARSIMGLANIIGSVLSFFFGFKKHRYEESKIREEDEYPFAPAFTERKVETSTGAGGQGQKR